MKTGTAVALSVLGLTAVGVTIGIAMSGSKPSGPPPPAQNADVQRGYQVLPSCRIAVLDDDSVAVLDANPTVRGARVRVIHFPASAAH